MKLNGINFKDVVTDKQKEKSTINLGWLIAAVFVLPLFITFGEWYAVGEMIILGFLLAFMAIAVVTQVIALFALSRARRENIELSTSIDSFFSGGAIFAWVVAAVIAGSIYMQGMYVLVAWYVSLAIINNFLRFIRMQVRNDIAAERLAEAVKELQDELGKVPK